MWFFKHSNIKACNSRNHEEQQTNLHNLQTTKHKKNRKEVKKKNTTTFNVHDCEPSPPLAFSVSHIHHNKLSIKFRKYRGFVER